LIDFDVHSLRTAGLAMKVKLDIDCSPEELRTFLGLPDLGPVQKIAIDAMAAKTAEAVAGMNPEAVIKAWLGAGGPALDALKAFWTKGTETT
jgi:hypothetical protein